MPFIGSPRPRETSASTAGSSKCVVARTIARARSGGSDDPLELLRRAGVDLESGEPYDETFATLERRIAQLESWVG